MNDLEKQPSSDAAVSLKEKLKKPNNYNIIMLNDDETSMDFVIHVLKRFFQKNPFEAEEIMMQVHNQGSAVCGTYPFEIAETKAKQTIDYARRHNYPLQCRVEAE